jgi:undecaprenyl-diphosphatase
MDLIHIVVLAMIQGLTEFLPVSSSAHLILVPQLLGWPDQGQAFDVAVHVGTLAAVVGYFHRDLLNMARDWTRSLATRQPVGSSQLAWAVIWGTVPAGIIGLALSDIVEAYLRSPLVIAAATVVFGLLLWWVSRTFVGTRTADELTWRDIAVVGFMQAIALIPGTSRSGITITAGMMMGLTPRAAARFSFLLSVPLIAAAGGLHILSLVQAGESADWGAIGAGALVAAVSAVACIHGFLILLERVGMMPFIIYRMALGAFLVYLFV